MTPMIRSKQISLALGRNETNRRAVFDFMRANYDPLVAKLPEHSMTRLMRGLGDLCTRDERDLYDIGNRRPYKFRVRVRADLMRSWRLYLIPWEVTTRWREARVQCPECKP